MTASSKDSNDRGAPDSAAATGDHDTPAATDRDANNADDAAAATGEKAGAAHAGNDHDHNDHGAHDGAAATGDHDKPVPVREKRGPVAVGRPRSPLLEIGKGAAWLIGLSLIGQIVAVLFRANPLAIVVLQAVIYDLALGRVGVRWDPSAKDDEQTSYGPALGHIARGAGAALAVSAAVIALSAAFGWAKVSLHGPTASLGFGLLRSIAIGVRDALMYTGLPIYFLGRARAPKIVAIVFAALAAGAALSFQPAATPAAIALAISASGAAAVFWAKDGVGWASAGLLGGFPLFAGVVFRGGLLDVDWRSGALVHGLTADGSPAWLGAAGFLVVAGLKWAQKAASGGGPRTARSAGPK